LKFDFVLRDKVHDARQVMLSRYQEPPSLHELAAMVGTNECTLKRAFKEEYGLTVFQCLFDYRMALAAKYLLDSQSPISEIATLLGFDYHSHFCTAFRRKFGMSPTDYRAKHHAFLPM
jgi:AraC-like DNA-binding protein